MNLYEILGVSTQANRDQIKKAYRKKARELHPDIGGDEEMFRSLAVAYSVLSDEGKRQRYDNGESVEEVSKATHHEQEVLKITVETFLHIVLNTNLATTDIFKAMKAHFEKQKIEIKSNLKKVDVIVAKLANAKSRVTSRAQGNIFSQVLDGEIANGKRQADQLHSRTRICDDALKIIEDYTWAVDEQMYQNVDQAIAAMMGIRPEMFR